MKCHLKLNIDITLHYAVRRVCGKRHKTVKCPSVCLSVPSIDKAATAGGFAAELGRGQQISIDSWCCRATCGPIKEVSASFFVIIIK